MKIPIERAAWSVLIRHPPTRDVQYLSPSTRRLTQADLCQLNLEQTMSVAFCKFPVPGGGEVYVNASQVQYLRSYDGDETTCVYFEAEQSITVNGSAAQVAQQLQAIR